jgi:hypothetical protein
MLDWLDNIWNHLSFSVFMDQSNFAIFAAGFMAICLVAYFMTRWREFLVLLLAGLIYLVPFILIQL